MKGHAYQPLRVIVENARKNGVDVDVFISTSTGIESIVGRTDSKDSGSKCGIMVNGFVVNTLNPLRVKPNHETYGNVGYADMTWNPSTAVAFIAELVKANKASTAETAETAVVETAETATVSEKPKRIIRKKRSA